MEAELQKVLELREWQNVNYEFLLKIMIELMNRAGGFWLDVGLWSPPKEIAGGYLYLMARVAEYAKHQLNSDNYHRFCEEATYIPF